MVVLKVPHSRGMLGLAMMALCIPALTFGQETDITQTPNAANAGIKKSLEDQVGAGRGDINTLDSSLYLINRDPFRSIVRGRQLFQRKFTVAQGFGPRTEDGVGDIETEGSLGAGLVDSCAGCHGRPKGSAGFGGNVFTRPDSRDAPHLFGLGIVEMLGDEITHDLRMIRDEAIQTAQDTGQAVSRRLMSKGIQYGSITANPDGSVDTSNVEGVNEDLRIRPFSHEGSTISIREFVVGALNAEMGMEAFDPDLANAVAGEKVVTPSGMVLDGSLDAIEAPPAISDSDDPDLDGVVNEVPTSLVDHMEFYLLNYFKPATYQQTRRTREGHRLFQRIQCTQCHKSDLVIEHDRRVADVETRYVGRALPSGPLDTPINNEDFGAESHLKGVSNFGEEELRLSRHTKLIRSRGRETDISSQFNNLFAMATPLISEVPNSGSPPQQAPLNESFRVKNIFADFKRHDLGPNFWERNFDGTLTKEFLTEPLWGVGSTAPYGHDGRSINLREVILRHGGEAQESRDAFARLSGNQQSRVVEFLQSLVLFGPPDTPSNLNPGSPDTPNFPQEGHGSIDLSVLFNDSSDPE